MKIVRTDSFKKDYQQLPSHVQKIFENKLRIFIQNINHPSLRVKKMQGHENRWEGNEKKTQGHFPDLCSKNHNTQATEYPVGSFFSIPSSPTP
ncbi:MAG: hypothetical protein Q7U13_07930, partial [Rhodoferax sp.]|nr:hypothetical protein [Rhodoferax sp.]